MVPYIIPYIENLSQIEKAIRGKEEFYISDHENFHVVNYAFVKEDTFPEISEQSPDAALLRECRGILFNKDGSLLAHSLHKFFNLGEKRETMPENIDFTLPHFILEKLDGSWIRPIFLNGKIRFVTKNGLTDVAQFAEEFSYAPENKKYLDFITKFIGKFTLHFEFMSARNRIIIQYPRDNMVLLAARRRDGKYVPYSCLKSMGELFNIPVVQQNHWGSIDVDGLASFVKNSTGYEGIVIRFDSGYMLKIKTDEYVRANRATEGLLNVRDRILAIIDENIDDMLPYVPTQLKGEVEQFRTSLVNGMWSCHKEVQEAVEHFKNSGETRKDFVLGFLSKKNWFTKSAILSCIDGKNPLEVIKNLIRKNVSTVGKRTKIEFLWNENHKF